jgi:hypothetical protein
MTKPHDLIKPLIQRNVLLWGLGRRLAFISALLLPLWWAVWAVFQAGQ